MEQQTTPTPALPQISAELKTFFTQNHTDRNWATEETVSGVGSELKFTEILRQNLAAFIANEEVKTWLDLPCGDLNWVRQMFKEYHLPEVKYTGADIAPNLIAENKAKFDTLEFKVLDITSSKLPAADLITVRDCLVHLPIALVHKALVNLANSNSKFIAITTFPEHPENVELDIIGGWRTLNLCNAPFNLPAPDFIISEECNEYGGVFKDKSLGVWTPAQIKEAISATASSL